LKENNSIKRESVVLFVIFLIVLIIIFNDNNVSASGCTSECTPYGATVCVSSYDAYGYETCADYNSDGCLEFGNFIACNSGEICQQGICIQDQTNNLPDIFLTASAYGNDITLNWEYSAYRSYRATRYLIKNTKTEKISSKDVINQVGYSIKDLTGNAIFGNFKDLFNDIISFFKNLFEKSPKGSGGTPKYIFDIYENNLFIKSGSENDVEYSCSSNKCSYLRSNLNNGNYNYFIRVKNFDGSFGLKDSNYVSLAVSAYEICSNDCQVNGQISCFGAYGYRTCGNYDNDPCLEWSLSQDCPANQICDSGSCVPIENIEIYPRTKLLKLNEESIINAYGGIRYSWQLEGNSCNIIEQSQDTKYIKIKGLSRGLCTIKARSLITNGEGFSFIFVSDINPIFEETLNVPAGELNPIILDSDNKISLNLKLSQSLSENAKIRIKRYDSNPVGKNNLVGNNKLKSLNFIEIDADKEIIDRLPVNPPPQIIPVKINIRYDKTYLIQNNINEDNLKTYYSSQPSNKWLEYENNLSKLDSIITIKSEHLSLFGLFGESSEVQSNENPPSDYGGGSSGGGGHYCLEEWQCTDWGDCRNGIQRRECNDLKYCNNNYPFINKPFEGAVCQPILKTGQIEEEQREENTGGELEQQIIEQNEQEVKNNGIIIYSIISVLLAIFIIKTLFKNKLNKKSKINKIIRDLEKEGYKEWDIKKELKKKGWSEEDIHNIFNEYAKVKETIKDLKEQGYKNDKIREELIKKGWNEEDIKNIFKNL